MKQTGLTLNPRNLIACTFAAIILLAGASITQAAAKIAARPLTHQEIHDNMLPEGTNASGGLFTVGVGEPVYLEALVDKGSIAMGVTWTLLEKAPNSSAALAASPIPMEIPTYSPADQEVFDLAGRSLLVPDAKGSYKVQAVVNVGGEMVTMTEYITAADYVGVGLMGGGTAQWPQCALCHKENAASFMGTGHASFFEEAVDGIKSSHYSENCITCHNLGGHVPDADNGNFASVAAAWNWTFPEVLQPGNWAAMPMELKAVSNIQCEHCHGAGSEHYGQMNKNQISLSLNSGDCAQCHDEEPYHNKNRQWNLSRHSVATRYPTGENRSGCVKCHSGIGFIQETDGIADNDKSTDYEAIVCAACHDPHSNDMDNHQLRTTAPVTLENGHVVDAGGNGKLCMNCHKSRRNAVDYVKGNISSHFGPHYGVQGDLFNGTNAIEYGKAIGRPSPHLYAVEDSCAGCHMQVLPGSDPAKNMAGEHTFKMMNDGVAMTAVCTDCHGPLDTFDIPKVDYNYDGVIEGLQTEVHHLLDALAMRLPPIGSPEVELDSSKYEYTDAQKEAIYNYKCVEEDGSAGMHNPLYITSILRASIDDLGDPFNDMFGGANIPVGGEWYYSTWFEFYAPLADPGWIYHFEHGHLYVSGDANKIYLYDVEKAKWVYTTKELYPYMYDVSGSAWMYYQGRYAGLRYFYNYNSGEWEITK